MIIMISIFDFENYREFLSTWVAADQSRGRGSKGRIAVALNVSSTLVSLVFKGEKNFTPEQASDLSDYLGLSDLEAEYLQLLTERERAGTQRYKDKINRKISTIKIQAKKIGQRVPRHKELTEEEKATYYSDWIYTGIRNLSALKDFDSPEKIASKLSLEPALVNRVIRFLLANGLCVEKDGHLTYGPKNIHVDRESPFVNQHHRNWRIVGMRQLDRRRDQDLYFTGVVSLSEEAAREVLKLIPTIIQNIMKIVGPSDSETVRCLNIDWFEY